MPPGAQVWVSLLPGDAIEEETQVDEFDGTIPGHPELNYMLGADEVFEFNHPEYNFTIDATSLTFGPVGFRDDGINGEAYAVAIGDSFVMGWGVEAQDTWVEQLENQTGVDVANLGMMGASTLKATSILDLYGSQLNPRLILYGVYLNDIDDEVQVRELLAAGQSDQGVEAQIAALENEIPFYRLRAFLNRNLYLYRLFGYYYFAYQGVVCLDNTGGLEHVFDISGWQGRLDLDDPVYVRGLEDLLGNIRDARTRSEAMGADFVLIIMPAKEQIYVEEVAENCQPSLSEAYLMEPVKRLEAFCEAEGLHCLNLVEAMRANGAKEEQVFYPMDAHLNAAGNRMAAGLILDYLSDQNLLPED
jgi:hypothetical protein